MKKKNYKGRCEKRTLSKCIGVCRTYDDIQSCYADILQTDDTITEFRCNVLLEGLTEGEYTSDFVCKKSDGDLMVRECVQRRLLTKPLTVKLLNLSREYWLNRGVTDWGLVIDVIISRSGKHRFAGRKAAARNDESSKAHKESGNSPS